MRSEQWTSLSPSKLPVRLNQGSLVVVTFTCCKLRWINCKNHQVSSKKLSELPGLLQESNVFYLSEEARPEESITMAWSRLLTALSKYIEHKNPECRDRLHVSLQLLKDISAWKIEEPDQVRAELYQIFWVQLLRGRPLTIWRFDICLVFEFGFGWSTSGNSLQKLLHGRLDRLHLLW